MFQVCEPKPPPNARHLIWDIQDNFESFKTVWVTATGKTEICLQIELTNFQTIGDKDEPLKKEVCVYVGNSLPLSASAIPAVTKRIVGIFDVMAERENFVGSHCQKAEEDFFFTSSL